jgi:hypothetical protein
MPLGMLTVGMSVRKNVQWGCEARKTCPLFGVFCFVGALLASLFGAKNVSADAPLAALKSTPIAAPAAVLGLSNPYLVAASVNRPSVERPEATGFTFSKNLRRMVDRVEVLARDGIALNTRRVTAEKLNLRVQSSLGGGVLQLRYRR